MCPSFMVTREEKDTTRGRAHLLFEMLRGETIGKNGWRDENVKDALDLCLACKGCKGDCPVNVDMATYKAEFLAHYYEGRLRPIHAYAFGLIHIWSQFAQISPSLVNFVNRAPLISNLVKGVIGVAQQREMPGFAAESFKSWFARHRGNFIGRAQPKPARRGEGAPAVAGIGDPGIRGRHGSTGITDAGYSKPRVILWPDTFNNYFHPATAKAAVEVLESAGFQVIVPKQDLCCGRPLYDYGMLGTARRWVLQILRSLADEIEAGVPIVGLEPSCTAVFRDEIYELFPQNENARRVKQQTFTLAEFLEKHAPDYQIPKLERKAVLHGHCHHKAIMNLDAEQKLLKKMGLSYHLLDSGCCGMAGAFGFEADHYDISVACGERVLLPAVRAAAKDTIVLADGFSCREQVKQRTDRVPLHIADLLKMAIDQGPRGPAGNLPERNYITHPAPPASAAKVLSILAIAALGLAAVGGIFKAKRKR